MTGSGGASGVIRAARRTVKSRCLRRIAWPVRLVSGDPAWLYWLYPCLHDTACTYLQGSALSQFSCRSKTIWSAQGDRSTRAREFEQQAPEGLWDGARLRRSWGILELLEGGKLAWSARKPRSAQRRVKGHPPVLCFLGFPATMLDRRAHRTVLQNARSTAAGLSFPVLRSPVRMFPNLFAFLNPQRLTSAHPQQVVGLSRLDKLGVTARRF